MLDKITDNLFSAKSILESVMKNKQSLSKDIMDKLTKAEKYVDVANSLIVRSDYPAQKINGNFLFLRQDISFILINDFYNMIMDVLNEIQEKYNFMCKKQLDI